MTTMRNFHDMERAMRRQETFQHRSYKGIRDPYKYTLYHWRTIIAQVDTDGEIIYFDAGHYSQTTSAFQGRIIRHALSTRGREQLKELLGGNKLRSIPIP